MSATLLDGPAIQTQRADVLVLGGGMAGSFAALAARRGGHSVVLVEPGNVLGGQGTTGGVAGFVGDTARVNPDFQELVARLERCGAIEPYRPNDDRRAYDLELCAFMLQEMLCERGVQILLHARALHARAAAGLVAEVLVLCGPSLLRCCSRVVIDATGNAVVPHLLGCPTVSLGAGRQLPMSLYFTLWDSGRAVTPFLPPGCPRWEDPADLPMTSLHVFDNGKIEVKMKVVGFDAADGASLSRAEMHARRQMMGLIYHLQTRGYGGRHAANGGRPLERHVLASVSRAIGQREGRRLVGRHVLVQDEIARGTAFTDAVAVGTYHFDFHWPDTEKRAGTGITTMVEPYHIPLRALLPPGVDNLLCPGRSMSGDQMALSSYRAMATCAQMGWGAGHAAAMALETGTALPALDPAGLRARIEAAGQTLDLSEYGDYLRCLRLTRECILAGEGANQAPELSLRRERDGAVVCRIATPGGKVRELVRRAAVWREQPPAAGETGLPAAPVPIGGGLLARAGHVELPTGSGLLVCLSADGGGQWNRRLTIATAADPATRPALLATPVGLAVAWRDQDGAIHYWEGAVERFGTDAAPPPDEATLQALPYANHVLLRP